MSCYFAAYDFFSGTSPIWLCCAELYAMSFSFPYLISKTKLVLAAIALLVLVVVVIVLAAVLGHEIAKEGT